MNAGFWMRVGWLAAAAAILGWFLVPALDADSTLVKGRDDRWELPALPRVFDQTSLAANVLAAPYWGAQPSLANPAAPVADPRWRVAGIFGDGTRRAVLIEFLVEGKAPLRLGVGDALPSGHRIERIDEREVCIRIGTRLYRLGVERIAI